MRKIPTPVEPSRYIGGLKKIKKTINLENNLIF